MKFARCCACSKGYQRSEISNLKSLAEGDSRQLRGWADSLQNTPIKGTRYLTDKVRKIEEAKKGRDEFLRELQRVQGKQ